jgi:hypothetical protein
METETMELTNKVQEIATEERMTFNQFAGRCLLRDLSYDTARDIWNNVAGPRGFNDRTKRIVSKILKRPVEDVFPT